MPGHPAYVEIALRAVACPVAVNGVAMPLIELIASLETIAGAHGVGRIDMVENRVVGIKSREVYEAPAAVVLHAAHRELQVGGDPARPRAAACTRSAMRYADLVYDGRWFTPMREAIDAFVAKVQERVTGTVRAEALQGARARRRALVAATRCTIAPLATYDAGDTFDHAAAAGFGQDRRAAGGGRGTPGARPRARRDAAGDETRSR